MHAIQVLLTPALLSFNPWFKDSESGFHGAQMAAYADNETAPIFVGSQGLDIDMAWLLKNVQFWRHHFVTGNEVLVPAFEALEGNERPQWWSEQLSQSSSRKIGTHWKGCYAFVERKEIGDIRAGRSGQGNVPAIMDHLNGEDNPYEAFQNIDLAITAPEDADEWNSSFEHVLRSLRTPQSVARTRAQHRDHPSHAFRDFRTQAVRIEGDGTDVEEDFFIDGWLNPLPGQHGVPGWQRLTMMKYFIEQNGYGEDEIDMEALWAYEGVMLPGGKIVVSFKRVFPLNDQHNILTRSFARSAAGGARPTVLATACTPARSSSGTSTPLSWTPTTSALLSTPARTPTRRRSRCSAESKLAQTYGVSYTCDPESLREQTIITTDTRIMFSTESPLAFS